MGLFKKYLFSEMAIPVSVAKKYIKKSRGNYKKLLNNIFGNKHRIVIDFKQSENDKLNLIKNSHLFKNIKNLLEKYNFKITPKDYLDGFSYKEKDFSERKNPYKIGKFLNKYEEGDKNLLYSYKIDPLRQTSKDLKIIISRHPYDIMGMSTDRNWTSCMDLGTDRIIYKDKDKKEGSNSTFMDNYIKNPTLISYLVSEDDFSPNGKPLIQRPLSRILIYPFKSDDGEIAYGYGEPYGVNSKEYKKQLGNWVDEILNAGIDNNKTYRRIPYVYYDNFNTNFQYEMTLEEIFLYYNKHISNINLGTEIHNIPSENSIYDIRFLDLLTKKSIQTINKIKDEYDRYEILENILIRVIPPIRKIWKNESHSIIYNYYNNGDIHMDQINLSEIFVDDDDLNKYGNNANLTLVLSTLQEIYKNYHKYKNKINHHILKISDKIDTINNTDEDIIEISDII